MTMRIALCIFVAGVMMSTPQVYAERMFQLVPKQGSPAAIMLGPQATSAERHAAEEFSSYIGQMTGARLKTISGLESAGRSVVLIGRPETNPVIAKLVRMGKLRLSADSPGLDGFIIKTIADGDRTYLVLGGSADRSALYAVYDFLERFCHVGFFWDCERVPKTKSLEFGDIDFSSRPYFEERQNMQGCAIMYSAQYWGWKDWKREVDWAAKKKFNIFHVYIGYYVAAHEAVKAMGVEAPEPTARDKAQAELAKKLVAYAHSIGLRTVTTIGIGEVPPAFKRRYPDTGYFEVAWLDYPAKLFIHPGDPLFTRYMTEMVRQLDRLYGTDHLYETAPYPETTPGASQDEKRELVVQFAKAVSNVAASVTPKGKLFMSGWAFIDRKYWTDDQIKAFLDVIPNEILTLNDVADKYAELNYFYGKQWGFSRLHSFGGNTHLHGDMPGLVKSMQGLVTDRRARNCKAFYLNPEIIRHNPFYFDLAAKLGWDPLAVKLDDYVSDYALRRYGEEPAVGMESCLRELIQSVYSRYDYVGPSYQSVPALDQRESLVSYTRSLPFLKKALKIALEQSDRQAGNECFKRDLVDIGKEYLGNVITQSHLDLLAAFRAKDRGAFAAAAERIRSGMDALETVVGLCPDYYLAEEINRAVKSPYSMKPADAVVDVRTVRSVWGDFEHYDSVLDYARKDMLELVKYYYRPRMELLISHLDECLKNGKEPSAKYIHDGCRDVCKRFVYDSAEATVPKWRGEVTSLVKSALSKAQH
ncbi:MAG: alpha-N-acetylglucosaminidase C-terminal domain-containing protein [Armatimonadetes bacterium]|nr:alpha-N-acetylglucosaminidase C-terminal domain-containing protein [Armatimonadota bacterium]